MVGATLEQIRHLGTSDDVRKLSLRDLPVAMARGWSGGTTVAATLHLAARSGIHVFATGGIGGVHRHGGTGLASDISADLPALARYPVLTVCAGAKSILDLEATVEMLETLGITTLGYQTERFPAFYSHDSDLPVDHRIDSPEEAAEIFAERVRSGLSGGVLLCVPIPQEAEIPRDELEPLIEAAVEEAMAAGLRAADMTPFLLSRIAAATEGRSVRANVALLEQNAVIAARVARVLHTLTNTTRI